MANNQPPGWFNPMQPSPPSQPIATPASSMMTMGQQPSGFAPMGQQPGFAGPNPQPSNFSNWANSMQGQASQNQQYYGQPAPQGFGSPSIPSNPSQFAQMLSFPGRYISNTNEISPQEIPNDGTICLYPSKDLQSIWLKAFNKMGKLVTVRYIVDPDQKPEEEPLDTQAQIFEKLSKIEEMLANKAKPRGGKPKEGGEE